MAILAMVTLVLLSAALGAAPQSVDPVSDAVRQGVEVVLKLQEGDPRGEWPYEGVYRVSEGGEHVIPIGYRVGGTAIAALALIRAPGYAEDPARRAAVAAATQFVASSIDHPLMSHRVEATYDVRGWGYAYGLSFLLAQRAAGHEPPDLASSVEAAIRFFIDGIEATAIPEIGGWNFARRGGFDAPSPQAPFMTAPTLMALYEAAAAGHAVNQEVVAAGIRALEQARTETGAFVYSGARPGEGRGDGRSAVPGSVGRMVVSELALALAGRSDALRLRSAVDGFLAHWDRLEERRAKSGTHAPPFGVAPYYFYFAHLYAAQAVELLPAADRPEYRQRIRGLLFKTRLEDGGWNDRVFPRSANYGTSMAILTLLAPDAPPPARWASLGANLSAP